MKYADVILPVPLYSDFTYLVPQNIEASVVVGMRVIVPLRNKFYTAIVLKIHDIKPDYDLKPIESLIDDKPIVTADQLSFWLWMAEYYISPIGDVYKAAVPSGLRLESESQVSLVEGTDVVALTPSEQRLVECFASDEILSVKDIQKMYGNASVLPIIRRLMDKGVVMVSEKLVETYHVRTEEFVSLSPAISSEADAERALESLRSAKKQLKLFSLFLQLSGVFKPDAILELPRRRLLRESECEASILRAVVKKGFLSVVEKPVSRLSDSIAGCMHHRMLDVDQQKAYDSILEQFASKTCVLLHGVTSSGKTEVYIHLIEHVLAQGKTALFLLPEIALTEQITLRLRAVFGADLGIYHSRYPDAERVEIWRKQLSASPYKVLVGVRSSLFLPMPDLGLIIVDEEHETSYKQADSPRYNARNAAVMMAVMRKCNVLLGSATPALETYNNALTHRYGLVTLTKRYSDIPLPSVTLIDMKEARRTKQLSGIFSYQLLSAIRQAVAERHQVILFQNRRGYSPFLQCPDCGYVPKCIHCDVSLTEHKSFRALTCHYCGYTVTLPQTCPKCGSSRIGSRGFGTERIEDELAPLVPEAKILRMDLDTTRSRTSYSKIINTFEAGEADILIGTQMVSKGLDFSNVSLVGVLNADNMLNYPDFRADERAFQMLLQVAGRAGRVGTQGQVLIQTSSVDSPVLAQVVDGDYSAMFKSQMNIRRDFSYPPFFRLIYVELRHTDYHVTNEVANIMAVKLREVFKDNVLGPDNPPVMRIQNRFIKRIVLKVASSAPALSVRETITRIADYVLSFDRFKGVRLSFDVDPM